MNSLARHLHFGVVELLLSRREARQQQGNGGQSPSEQNRKRSLSAGFVLMDPNRTERAVRRLFEGLHGQLPNTGLMNAKKLPVRWTRADHPCGRDDPVRSVSSHELFAQSSLLLVTVPSWNASRAPLKTRKVFSRNRCSGFLGTMSATQSSSGSRCRNSFTCLSGRGGGGVRTPED